MRPQPSPRAGAVALRLAALSAALLVSDGCGKRAAQDPEAAGGDEDRIIARVDGEHVPRGLFEAYLRDNITLLDEGPRATEGGKGTADGASSSSLSDEVKSRLLDRFLQEQALLHQARERGLAATEEDLDRFSRALDLGPLASLHEGAPITEREYLRRYLEDCFLVKSYLERYVLKDVSATEEEARAYYGAHASRFSHPDRYRLRLIRVDAMQEAQDLARQIGKDGTATFAQAARSLSDGVEGEQGKDLGLWRIDQLPESIAAAVAPLHKGQVSGVVQDPDGGCNLFYVEDKQEGGTVPFETVRASLMKRVEREKKSEVLAAYLKEFEKNVRIELDEGNLGFTYTARAAAAAAPASTAPELGAPAGSPSPAATPPSGGA